MMRDFEELKAELTVDTLTYSIADDDNKMDLLFDVDGETWMASGNCPEGAVVNEGYWESQENIDAFLEDAEIVRK